MTRSARSSGSPELDLDHFKAVNDRHGHAAGDAVLRRLGDRLLRGFGSSDVVARWGGEEFVVGMYGMAREDGVQRIAEFLEAFREEEFHSGADSFRLTFSAGVAQFPDDGEDVERLYDAADLALYHAKSAGRDRVVAAGRGHEQPADRIDVVIVEDDALVGELLTQALRRRGLRTQWFTDGSEAATAICDGRLAADVVLLDVGLPGLDGVSVLNRMREAGVLHGTRVIMLTASTSEAAVLSTLALGATDHVAKPFSVPVLMHKVRCALGR